MLAIQAQARTTRAVRAELARSHESFSASGAEICDFLLEHEVLLGKTCEDEAICWNIKMRSKFEPTNSTSCRACDP